MAAGQPAILRSHRSGEVQEAICKSIRNGNTIDVSARLAGVGLSTVMLWRKRGRDAKVREAQGLEIPDDERPYVEFLDQTEKAEAEAIARNVQLIQLAAQNSWQAAAWYLERRRPEQWGRHSASEQILAQVAADTSAKMERFIREVLSNVSNPDERRAIVARYQQLSGGDVVETRLADSGRPRPAGPVDE